MTKRFICMACAASCLVSITSCDKKDENSAVEITPEQAQGNFVQMDENGNVYTVDENGSRVYGDEESTTESTVDNSFAGEYKGHNFILTTTNDWYIDLTDDEVTIKLYNYGDTMNQIQIYTFDESYIDDYDVLTEEQMKQNYDEAVDEGGYDKAYDSVYEIGEVEGYETKIFRITVEIDDDKINITHYFVNDDFGGHSFVVADVVDEVSMEECLEDVIGTIKFAEISTDEETTINTDSDNMTDTESE